MSLITRNEVSSLLIGKLDGDHVSIKSIRCGVAAVELVDLPKVKGCNGWHLQRRVVAASRLRDIDINRENS